MGCCLGVLLLAGAPRLALFVWWLFDSVRVTGAFNWTLAPGGFTIPVWVWPALGFLFLPWLTVAYVFVSPGGVVGLEWLILGLGLALDVGVVGGGREARRRRAIA
ncbi:MAG: hypothetical protein U1E29_07835 [Coriobacteriia bacterium]|nr:hypothetical protein [Coriobacteriia bacterium]